MTRQPFVPADTSTLTGRDIVLAAARGQVTPRPAWVPFVGSHGAYLIGEHAHDYLTNADLIVAGLRKARELYRPDGLPVIFDLQLEAEILGCELQWTTEGPPSVITHPLSHRSDWSADDLPELDLTQGRFPMVLEATRRVKAEMGDEVAIYGLIAGPFTLALHLLGTDIFLEMYDEEEKVEALLMRCAGYAKQVAQAYIEAGADVIAVVDPMTSQISPNHFEMFVTPAMNDVFGHIRTLGALSSCFVCGDVTRNLEAMCRTTCDYISVDEQIDMARLRDLARANGKGFGGNLKLTVVLLLGNESDAKLNAIDCIDTCGTQGYILSPGCDLPFNTPPANVAAAGLMALDAYQRDVARQTAQASHITGIDQVSRPDYDRLPYVTLDVITLDSASCAPCQYMMVAAERAASTYGEQVVVREHKIKQADGIGMMMALGVQALPTVCIDGDPKFVSIIPDRPTLEQAIRDRLVARGLA